MNNTIFSWQKAQWNLLQHVRKIQRLPHALLFIGALGVGKKQFTELFSASLLCEQPAARGYACGTCHACALVRAKSHPDLLWVVPEQPGQMIKIDQIRDIVNVSNETAMQGNCKVIIIDPADAMNAYATNALLKTLEEATPNTFFILISEEILRLPSTVTSRCQRLTFQKPERQEALDWLRSQTSNQDTDWELALTVAEGSPLQARMLVEQGVMTWRKTIYSGLLDLSYGAADPLKIAAQWHEHDIQMVFYLLLQGLRDLLRFQLTSSQIVMVNQDHRNILLNFAQRISQQNLLNYIELVQERHQQVLNLQNLNRQLLLEELLIRWKKFYAVR